MTKDFEAKIIRERIVDTKQYRYIISEEHNDSEQWAEIKRLPITKLDTTAAITDGETVKRIG